MVLAMTLTETRAHLQKALDAAKPHCFVPVSAQALAVVLAQLQPEESSDGDTDAQ